ncbi:rCG61825 [Rattus norvegicus]|uniref:RCG61825 n=1 Tax=Rattus norvegicus TaxID=10116 RepID=A6HBK4_RAT|nr:rCG61825 [Rattus norvegicus]
MWVHRSCLQTHQKRASDPITDGCEPPCVAGNLNSGPLQEQSVLLTTEPSITPAPHYGICIWASLNFSPIHCLLAPKLSVNTPLTQGKQCACEKARQSLFFPTSIHTFPSRSFPYVVNRFMLKYIVYS